MGQNPRGPDYGVFNFVEFFSQTLFNAPFESLVGDAREDFPAKFQHKVSDHMPLWMRLPLPE
ncbi:MAG: hypothetical protein IIB17_09840 [Chloroflexi bacterium]|nr:hypothetical protein [Chloroflexota bacterium]